MLPSGYYTHILVCVYIYSAYIIYIYIYSHVSFIRSSIILLFHDPHILHRNHLNTIYNTVYSTFRLSNQIFGINKT